MAELLSRDKICGGKSLLFLQIIECFSRMCLCFHGQSLPWKDEILFPSWISSPFVVLIPLEYHVLSVLLHYAAKCTFHAYCVWLQSQDAIGTQTGQGRSLFESFLQFFDQRHERPLVSFLVCWCYHHIASLAMTLRVWVMTTGLQSKLHFLTLLLLDEKQLIPAQLDERSAFLDGRKQIFKSSGRVVHIQKSQSSLQPDKWARLEGCYDLGFSTSLMFWYENSICIKAGKYISIKKAVVLIKLHFLTKNSLCWKIPNISYKIPFGWQTH